MPKYRSEDYDDYDQWAPNERNYEISAEDAIEHSRFDSIQDVQREALQGASGGIPACCTCMSIVEPDGHCPHGNPSILLKKKLI